MMLRQLEFFKLDRANLIFTRVINLINEEYKSREEAALLDFETLVH